ncbi:phage filamentation protein Fil family protein [Serratia proteamaculans]
MMTQQCPSLASMLICNQTVTHWHHTQGWIETPDGRHFQPKPGKVRFIKGMSKPVVYTSKINKGFFTLSRFFNVLI